MLPVLLLPLRQLKTSTFSPQRRLGIRALLFILVLIIFSLSAVLVFPNWSEKEARSEFQQNDSHGSEIRPANLSSIVFRGPNALNSNAEAPLTWNWTHNVGTTQNPTSVVKNGGNNGFNDGWAYSNEALTLDGDYVQWTMANTLECSIALTAVYSNNLPLYPNFWADFYYGGWGENFYCIEGWADSGPGTVNCTGPYTTSSVFKLLRLCDRIEFYVDGIKVGERIGTLPSHLYVVFQAGELSAGANNVVVNSQTPGCVCPNIPIVP